ncbi:flagellar assembly protein A [Campylobacter sputorum]|uniref:flagellar assembly protein A n=1 Tax=Campylobacter sputorum TaxID=206 RepID=UPI001E5BF38E|nr:flagellar assembly protein A [Campylobacter sputorum]
MPSDKFLDPITIETNNIKKELERLSSNYEIDIKNIDYDLISVACVYKLGSLEQKTITVDKFGIFDDNKFFSDKNLILNQSYKIAFYDKRNHIYPKLPDINLAINKNFTKVICIVKAMPDLMYYDEFGDEMLKFINKKLLTSRILIGIRKEELTQSLKDISDDLRQNNALDKDYNFTITTGVLPVLSVDDDLIFHYKNKIINTKEDGNIDYSERGFLYGVAKYEVIIEYIKPRMGICGRDVFGKIIEIKTPNRTFDPNLSISENIQKQEDDNSIKFIAQKSGYVVEEDGKFDIKEDLEVSNLSFKNTGSVSVGTENNVKLNVTQKDVNKDAVGANISIETSEITISGSVGQEAKIKANIVEVGGVTHSTSFIQTKKAKIATHIGTLECDECDINRLEKGKVFGKIIHIGSALGGEISGEEIYIDNLVSNVTITASKLIEINQNIGSSNKLIIDPTAIHAYLDQISNYQSEIKALNLDIEKLLKEIKKTKITIDDSKESINTIKDQIKKMMEKKIKIPSAFMIKLKEYKTLIKNYNDMISEYKDKNYTLETIHSNLKNIQNKIFDAQIKIKGTWEDMNDIIFVLIDPPKKLNYVTIKNDFIKLFKVEERINEEYYIYKGFEK